MLPTWVEENLGEVFTVEEHTHTHTQLIGSALHLDD